MCGSWLKCCKDTAFYDRKSRQAYSDGDIWLIFHKEVEVFKTKKKMVGDRAGIVGKKEKHL